MGFSISWVAFEGLDKPEALARLGLEDTDRPDDANRAPFSCAQLPTGWTILISNDFDFASDERLKALSEGVQVLGGRVEEHIMHCATSAWRDGRPSWRIVHDSSVGLRHLDADGALPDTFETARASALAELAEDGGDDSEVDYVFDVPVEVAAAVCGWRHDQWKFDWGEPRFTAVRDPARPRSILARLFRR
jgi:hypothetical protein